MKDFTELFKSEEARLARANRKVSAIEEENARIREVIASTQANWKRETEQLRSLNLAVTAAEAKKKQLEASAASQALELFSLKQTSQSEQLRFRALQERQKKLTDAKRHAEAALRAAQAQVRRQLAPQLQNVSAEIRHLEKSVGARTAHWQLEKRTLEKKVAALRSEAKSHEGFLRFRSQVESEALRCTTNQVFEPLLQIIKNQNEQY